MSGNSLDQVLSTIGPRIVACSGGVDSLLLATVAHRLAPVHTVIAHAVGPAVPSEATARTTMLAASEGWQLEVVEPREILDERYVSNPTDRCYFCKTHLYSALRSLSASLVHRSGWTLLSGANLDDLADYRPGLVAAAEHEVRHPYVEAGMTKADIRNAARDLGLDAAELPASPCLASRLYTGTRVTPARLRAVEAGESLLRRVTGIAVVRCRLNGDEVRIEVEESDRSLITAELLDRVGKHMRQADSAIGKIHLDERAYLPGRAVLRIV